MKPAEYAKAIAGAVTGLVVGLAAHYGFELPAEVIVPLEALIAAAVVWWVPNAEPGGGA